MLIPSGIARKVPAALHSRAFWNAHHVKAGARRLHTSTRLRPVNLSNEFAIEELVPMCALRGTGTYSVDESRGVGTCTVRLQDD